MAINFPSNPNNGAIFTDPSGQQWVYNSSDKSWTGLGISVDPGGLQYQGGLNITSAPPTAQSGQFWSVETGGTANAGFGPGVTGTIPAGSFVLYDGVNWELLETSSLWNRTGGLIQPVNQNDVIQTDSGLKVGPSGTPKIALNADGTGDFDDQVTIGSGATPYYESALTTVGAASIKTGVGATEATINLVGPTNHGVAAIRGGGSNSAGYLALYTRQAGNTNEKVRINEFGNVLIGGTLPSAPNISLNANGVAQAKGGFIAKQNSGYFFVGQSTSNVNKCLLSSDGSATFSGTILYEQTSAPGGTTAIQVKDGSSTVFRVYANGETVVPNTAYFGGGGTKLYANGGVDVAGNLTIGQSSTLNANGSAQFAGSVSIGGSAAANTIDEYEEGSYTPAFNAGTYSYNFQIGSYVKIGTLVTVIFDLQVGSVTSATTGTIQISLPFTNNNITGGGIMYPSGILSVSTSIGNSKVANSIQAQNNIALVSVKLLNGSSGSVARYEDLQANTRFSGSITYTTSQ